MSDLSPRQWGKGDPEPPSLVQLRDQRGDRLIHDQGKWVFVECDGEPPEVYDSGASWAELDKLYDIEWPLTEVLPHLHWPYPDEPGQECFCAIGADHGPPLSQSSQDAPKPVSPSDGQGSGETPATDELKAIRAAALQEMVRRHGICLTIEPPSPLSTPDTRSGEANGEASGEASGEGDSDARTARSAPQRIPAESRSTMDSGEDVAKHDPRPRRGNAIAEPNACGQCGIPQREHYTQVGSDGSHTHVQPTDAQRKARMRARREASAPFVPAADTFPEEQS